MFDQGRDSKPGIEPRGTQILDIYASHHEDHVMLLRHFRVGCAGFAQSLGAGPLGEAEVGRMVDHTRCVRVFVIDP